MTISVARPPRRRVGPSGSLDDLTRRIGILGGVEPQVSVRLRQELFEELHQLDVDVERLVLRATANGVVPLDELSSCQQRFRWLCERWGAAPSHWRAA